MDFIIYKLTNEDGRIYVGSTTVGLKQRMWHHKCHTGCACADFNWDNVEVEVLEEGSGDDRVIRERYHMEQYECCNKNRAYQTKEEYIKQKKEYRENNSDRENKRRSIKILCECGAEVSIRNIARHKKSKKHLKLISN